MAVPVALGAGRAWAHAFGERYELPLPLGLYLGAAGAAVVLSFLVVGFFIRSAPKARDYPILDLSAIRLVRFLVHPVFASVLEILAVALFALIVAAGFLGAQDPFRNIAPVSVWILFWVGMAFVSAFVGDLWPAINPWRILFAWAEALWRGLRPGRTLALDLPYPGSAGVWPAVGLLFAFAWIELISDRSAEPARIAAMAAGYSILTWTGMLLFGRDRWLGQGEVFSVVFSVLARFAPTESRIGRDGVRIWALRPFAVGLTRVEPADNSMVALVLLYLVAVVFDGLLTTPAWAAFEAAAVAGGASPGTTGIRTLGLVGLWLAGSGLYLAACRCMAALAGEDQVGAGEIARRFVMTLVPIAIAYHLAHYLAYALIYGQYVIPIASDPFGRGWDVFGTAGYRVDVGLVGARFAWHVAAVAIVVGHVIAVVLAHARATALFGAGRRAVRSQYPLTALMVVFTVSSLSILAEPTLQRPSTPEGGGEANRVAVPTTAVLPEFGSGRLRPVDPGQTAAAKLTYGVMASPFHDGTAMTGADLLYPYAMAYRWGGDAGASDRGDPAIAAAATGMGARLKGIRYSGVDPTAKNIRFGELSYARERMLVDIYLDAPADDSKTTAIAPPWSAVPWHVLALMEEAVARGMAAFSRAEAERLRVEWLDLARSAPLGRRLLALVQEFEREGFIPEPLTGLATTAEARARWKALTAFHAAHGHFLVTNGPYRLQAWDRDSVTLAVVRDPRYPLGIGSYDSYAIPRQAFITGTEIVPEGIALSVEIDVVETAGRDYRLARRPLESVLRDARKPPSVEARYVAVAADGRVARVGRGILRKDGVMILGLRGELPPGRYAILATVSVNNNAIGGEVRRIPYEAAEVR